MTGIPSYFSGAPYQLTFSQGVSGCPTGRPNFIGNPVPANRSVNQWFNPKAFAVPANCTYGNGSIQFLFAPNNVVLEYRTVSQPAADRAILSSDPSRSIQCAEPPPVGNSKK